MMRTASTRAPHVPLVAFIVVLALVYGYEVFSYHLTIDEELTGWGFFNVNTWLSEGRWTTAALSLLVPTTVTPVVSTALGIGLSGAAWWILCRRTFHLTPIRAAFAAGLAATLPPLALTFSFSTIAIGIGVGNMLLVTVALGMESRRPIRNVAAVLAGAAAIGVYDPFVIGLAAVVLALVLKQPAIRTVLKGGAALVVSLVLARLVGWVLQAITNNPPSEYVSSRVDFAGFLDHPLARLRDGAQNAFHTLTLSSDLFGLHSPWLAIVVTILGVCALAAAFRRGTPIAQVVLRLVALGALASIPVLAEAASPDFVRLRGMIYLPILVVILFWIAGRGIRDLPPLPRRVLGVIVATTTVLAIVGNAVLVNRLFATAETSYSIDQQIAYDIALQKNLEVGSPLTEIPLVVSGQIDWPRTELFRPQETIGLSFFGRPSKDAVRIIAFLRSQGVAVRVATPSEILEGREALADMPPYPSPGWVDVQDGVLLINLSD